MATMTPENVDQFTTEGERQTYRFLEAVAKPDARFLCWYLPDVQGLEPDFILYSQQNGLIILEVKDWNLSQIREVNPHHFVLDIGGKTEERFSPRFAFRLSGPEMDHLKQLIFPAVRVEIPERGSERPYKKRICRLRGLDHHQEALARKFENGHRIIIGPSGCGKTLILVHKADCLFRYNSKIKSILFICYNITLANYIRRLLAEKGVPFGRNGVQVKHFYELCSKIIGESVEYENEDSDYFDFHGPEPELKELKDLDAVVAFTADKIGQVVKAEGCPYSEIAVIYTLKRPDPEISCWQLIKKLGQAKYVKKALYWVVPFIPFIYHPEKTKKTVAIGTSS